MESRRTRYVLLVPRPLKHPSQFASLLQLFAHVFTTRKFYISYVTWAPLTASPVPLATLVSTTRSPAKKDDVILSPNGFKRYFVAHGGLFSKDGITLDEIRQIKRIGRQPGTEGLICTSPLVFMTSHDSTHLHPQARFVIQTFHCWKSIVKYYRSSSGRTRRNRPDGDQVNV